MDRSHFAQKPLGPEPSIEDINAEVEARHQEDLRRRAEVRATQIHEAAIKGAERATADATAGGTSVGRAAFASGADRSREAALSIVEFADANAHDLDSYLAGLEHWDWSSADRPGALTLPASLPQRPGSNSRVIWAARIAEPGRSYARCPYDQGFRRP
jgi:hypothetical protein